MLARENRRTVYVSALLIIFFLVGLVLYAPVLHGQPLWDDWFFIFKSWTLNHASPFDFWKWGEFRRSWPVFYSILSVMLKIWKEDVFYYHLFSLTLHALNTFLFYKILQKLGRGYSLLLSAIYLVHPLHFFTIVWIVQLKTLLASFFFLLSLNLYIKEQRTLISYIASIVFFAFSLLSKSVFAPLIILMPFLKKERVRLIPFMVIGLYSIGLTAWSSFLSRLLALVPRTFLAEAYALEKASNLISNSSSLSEKWNDLVLAAVNFSKYLAYTVYPWDNLLVHPSTQVDGSIWQLVGVYLSFFVLAFILMTLYRKKDFVGLTGIIFFIISLVPLCGMIPIPIFHYSNFVEYWLSVPFLGLLLALSRFETKLNWVLFGCAMVVFYTGITFTSARKQSGAVQMITRSMEKSPDNELIELILAKHYFHTKEYAKSNSILIKVKKRQMYMENKDKIEVDIQENLKGMRGEKVNEYTL